MNNEVNRAPKAKNESKYIVDPNDEPNGCRDTFIGYVIGLVIAFIFCVCFAGCKTVPFL